MVQIHVCEPLGDILVFLTGEEEIEDACKKIAKEVAQMGEQVRKQSPAAFLYEHNKPTELGVSGGTHLEHQCRCKYCAASAVMPVRRCLQTHHAQASSLQGRFARQARTRAGLILKLRVSTHICTAFDAAFTCF